MPELSRAEIIQIRNNFPKIARRKRAYFLAEARLCGLDSNAAHQLADRRIALEMRSLALLCEAYGGSNAKQLMESLND